MPEDRCALAAEHGFPPYPFLPIDFVRGEAYPKSASLVYIRVISLKNCEALSSRRTALEPAKLETTLAVVELGHL